jgi:lipopolysaccharide biosynthesis regulator YciM
VASGKVDQARALLEQHYAQAPSLDVLDAIVSLSQGTDAARRAPRPGATGTCATWRRSLRWWPPPNGWRASDWNTKQHHRAVQRALDHATLPLTRYRCAACGFEARQHFWQCPGCQSWDSYPARRIEEL